MRCAGRTDAMDQHDIVITRLRDGALRMSAPATINEPDPAACAPGRVSDLRGYALSVGLPILFGCSLILIWQLLVRAFNVPPYVLPAPTEIASAVIQYFGPILSFAKITATSTLIGFFLGVTIGLLLGGLLGSSRLLFEMIYPSLIAFHAIPSVALIPLFILWFGVGTQTSILTATLGAYFSVTIVVSNAIAASSPELDDVLRSLGARKSDVLFKVAIPGAMPQFFSSVKLAITAAFIGAVVAEIYAGSPGVGRVMMVAANDLNGPLAFAGLTFLATMGIALYVASTFLERRLAGWAYRGR